VSGNAKTRRAHRRAADRAEVRAANVRRIVREHWPQVSLPSATTFFRIDRSGNPQRLAGMRVSANTDMRDAIQRGAEFLRVQPADAYETRLGWYAQTPAMGSGFRLWGWGEDPELGPENNAAYMPCCSDPEHDETCGFSLELALECARWTLARRHELWIRGEGKEGEE
jgi:hypothetical protein